jgi:hypothetical protein
MAVKTLDIRLSKYEEGYQVQIDHPPVGETSQAILQLPYSFEWYRQQLANLSTESLKEIGQSLFRALFPGDLYLLLQRNREHARAYGGLRLQFDIGSTLLANLPWETLYDPGDDDPLALQPSCSISRLKEINVPVAPPPTETALRWIYAGASPVGDIQLNVSAEARQLEAIFAHAQKTFPVTFNFLLPAGVKGLEQLLLQQKPHVIALSCHGVLDDEQVAGLRLVDEYGDGYTVKVDRVRMLFNQPSLRLAILNVCRSGQSSHLTYGLAATILRAGIPAVIAMQNLISDTSANTFSEGLVRALTEHKSLDDALYHGRRAIYQNSSLTEWYLPILFHSEHTIELWNFKSPSVDIPTEGRPTTITYNNRVKQGIIVNHAGTIHQHNSGDQNERKDTD